jgi:hypothetical protein
MPTDISPPRPPSRGGASSLSRGGEGQGEGGSKEHIVQTRSIGKVTLYFEAEENEAAELVASACRRSQELIGDLWQLAPPCRCATPASRT